MWINIDSDGVVYDLHQRIVEVAKQLDPSHMYFSPSQWSIQDAWGVSDEFMYSIWSSPGLYSLGHQIPGAVEAVRELALRYNVRIITHKHSMPSVHKSIEEMIWWYENHGLLELVDLVVPRGRKDEYPAQFTVDDHPNLNWVQKDAVNILFDRTWNRHVDLDNAPAPVIRMSDWNSILELINEHYPVFSKQARPRF